MGAPTGLPPEPFFCGPGLDRADALRSDESALEELAARPELAKQAEQINTIARMVHRTRHAELSHDHALRQQLNRSQGLGLSR